VAVEAKPLLAEEAKRNQQAAGKQFGKGIASVKNDKSYEKPVNVRKEVAAQFDVSQGYVYAAQKIRELGTGRFLGHPVPEPYNSPTDFISAIVVLMRANRSLTAGTVMHITLAIFS
jgi:hypothetical protein